MRNYKFQIRLCGLALWEWLKIIPSKHQLLLNLNDQNKSAHFGPHNEMLKHWEDEYLLFSNVSSSKNFKCFSTKLSVNIPKFGFFFFFKKFLKLFL